MMRSILKLKYYKTVSQINKAKDYYKILNISKTANENQIKKGFYLLAKKYHPDANKGKQQLFKQVNQAYQVLSDPQLKKQYDDSRFNTKTQQYANQTQQNYSNNNSKQYNSNPYYSQNPYKQRKQQDFYNANWSNSQFRQQLFNQINKARQQRRTNQAKYRRQTYDNDRRNDGKSSRKSFTDYELYEDQMIKSRINSEKRFQEQIARAKRQYEQEQRQQYQAQRRDEQNYANFKKELKNEADKIKNDIEKIGQKLKGIWQRFKK